MRCATPNMRRCSTPIATRSKRRSEARGRAPPKPDVTLVEFFDYACPYCKASNPHIDRLVKEDTGLRVVYRELPILGPDSVVAARLSLAASKAGKFLQFHDTLWEAGRPRPETLGSAAQAAGIPPAPPTTAVEAELKNNLPPRRQARRDRHAPVRDRRPGAERRGRLRALKKAIADARKKPDDLRQASRHVTPRRKRSAQLMVGTRPSARDRGSAR